MQDVVTKQAGGLITRLAGDNPRNSRSLRKFNAGGVVPPRSVSPREAKSKLDARTTTPPKAWRSSEHIDETVENRGSTTPPALNFANYLTIRALTYAVTIVYRPPACLWRRGYLGLRPAPGVADIQVAGLLLVPWIFRPPACLVGGFFIWA